MEAREHKPGLKAVYGIGELANLMGMTPQATRFWLERNGVETVRSGRTVLVPISAIATAFPAVYASLMIVVGARRGGDT